MYAKLSIKTFVRPIALLGALVTMAIVLAACAPATTAAVTTPSVTLPPATQPVSAAPSATIDVATSPTLGSYLVDSSGRTLYVFAKDTAGTSTCDAACQSNWPPFVSASAAKAGPGVQASLIGSTSLANGEKIITYDHHPLYYRRSDMKAGDVTGEGANNVWFVVAPSGSTVPLPSSSVPSAAPPAAATPGAASPTPAPILEPTLDVRTDPLLGKILVANAGMTLYTYSADSQDVSNCAGPCLTAWSPLLTNGKPNIGSGITPALLGTARLANGTMVVTYHHMPLYTFTGDTAAGLTNGQGFDNAWFAIAPDGAKVGKQTEVSLAIGSHPLLGNYLVDGKGIALYAFASDPPDKSTCDAACMAFWPPVLTLGKPSINFDKTNVGTLTLADGRMMLTYNHMPLYYFVGDYKSGQVNGQGVKKLWNLVARDGSKITFMLPTPITAEPAINLVTNPTYGQILSDGNGMTLYINVNDLHGESVCGAACLQYWTPLFTLGHPVLGTGVNPKLIGTITTSYGFMIVTYNNKPLYLAKSDTKPGDVSGEDANIAWYVISPAGQPILTR